MYSLLFARRWSASGTKSKKVAVLVPATKLTKYTEENENTTRQMEHNKQKIEQLIADNKHITTDVKMYKSKCSSYENEIFNLKSQIETNEFDKESLQIDLNDQKSILNQTESYNSKLEQNLIEVTFFKITIVKLS